MAVEIKKVRSCVLISLMLISQAGMAKSSSETAGDVLQYAIPLTGLGMAVANDDTEGIKQLGKTMLTNVATTYGMKYAFNDTSWGKRPNGSDYSFPSGHTSDACAGATFIGQRYGWRYGAVAMLPAAYVGWSRVDADKHHVRDIIAGCAVGTMSGLVMTQPFNNSTITPWYENHTLGLQISSTW